MVNIAGTIIYLLIAIAIFQNWLIICLFSVTIFSLRFGAAWLIPLAIFTDGYYGNYYGAPLLSLVAIVWYIFIEYTRPKILNPGMVNKSSWD